MLDRIARGAKYLPLNPMNSMNSTTNYHGAAHVGLSKTASTYLQKHYFSVLSRNFWSTQAPFSWPRELNFIFQGNRLWYRDILGGAGRYWSRAERSQHYASVTRLLVPEWRRAARSFAALRDSQWLLSAEGLSGIASDVNALHMSLLKDAGVTKVIFICRQQVSWAISLWRQFLLAEDSFARFVSFETLFGSFEADGVVDLDWNLYIQAMDAEFGADNVLVLPYELLLHDSQAFFRRLNVFLGFAEDALIPDPGTRENPSRTDSVYQGLILDRFFPIDRLPRVRARLHRLFRKFPQWVTNLIKETHSMTLAQETLDALQQRFSAANQRLEARIGINLKQYGYY